MLDYLKMDPKQVTDKASPNKSANSSLETYSLEATLAMDSFHHAQETKTNELEKDLRSKGCSQQDINDQLYTAFVRAMKSVDDDWPSEERTSMQADCWKSHNIRVRALERKVNDSGAKGTKGVGQEQKDAGRST